MTSYGTNGTALITGASSGIGAIYADRLLQRGFDLILVARNEARLSALRERLVGTTGRSVVILTADLTDARQSAKVEDLLNTNDQLTMLVNNAGVGAAGPLLDSDMDQMAAMISLNVSALTRLTYAAVPGLVARGKGTIINISSVVGVAPEMLNGVYGATKAYVLAFSQSLHKELSDKNVRVQAVLPGATATEFWDIAGMPVSNLPAEMVMTAGAMVDAALAGLDLGELITIPSLPNVADWDAYEAARQVLMPNLSKTNPAARYLELAGIRNTPL